MFLFVLLLSPLPVPSITLPSPPPIERKYVVKSEKPVEKQNYIVNDATEVTLDGAKVTFKNVPADATVEGLDLAADKTTILRIFFRSKKP